METMNHSVYKIFFLGVGACVALVAAVVFIRGVPETQRAAVGDAVSDVSPQAMLIQDAQPAAAFGVETDSYLLNQILEINMIRLDTNFFESSLFLSLVDFSQTIAPQSVGRLDPFSPVSGSR